MSPPDNAIRRFSTFEELETAFRQRTVFAVPRQYGGLRRFWEDFRQLHGSDGMDTAARAKTAWITINPRDCLAFGTAEQVLQAAVLSAGTVPEKGQTTVAALAEAYDLTRQLSQPLRTLSGGETVRLALAKTAASADQIERLTIASPFSWLSSEGRRHFDRLTGLLLNRSISVELLTLDGEDSLEPITTSTAWVGGPRFRLRFDKAAFLLGTPLDDIFGRQTRAVIADFDSELCSPCLLTGGNGKGKSLVAKVLAGAIGCEGAVGVGRSRASGRARLLFQDVVTQTLMRPPVRLAAAKDDMAVYRLIRDGLPEALRALTPERPDRGHPAEAQSLLVVKMLLAATRVSDRPGAVILDEPDWGLSRTAAVGLVDSVVAAAHEWEVPVILISHKPWWTASAASQVRVEKGISGSTEDRVRLSFMLQVMEAQ